MVNATMVKPKLTNKICKSKINSVTKLNRCKNKELRFLAMEGLEYHATGFEWNDKCTVS